MSRGQGLRGGAISGCAAKSYASTHADKHPCKQAGRHRQAGEGRHAGMQAMQASRQAVGNALEVHTLAVAEGHRAVVAHIDLWTVREEEGG